MISDINQIENRINDLLSSKKDILSVYFTAGFPTLETTAGIIQILEREGADMVEIGIPFSDPTADGPVIQQSNEAALKNGMNLKLLFSQLANIREKVNIPLLLMGYVNPVYQYGMENFCRKCSETGIDGVILPDLPPEEYIENYRNFFIQNNLHNILLVTPQTSEERIREIDRISSGFIYMVSSASTTGTTRKADDFHTDYFEKIMKMNLKNPCLIGFGIYDRTTFEKACRYASGAIIGSAFIRSFSDQLPFDQTIPEFIRKIKIHRH